MYYGDHMSTGSWVLMSVGIVILLVLLVALVWWIISQQRISDGGERPRPSARETLDHRLVNGEITSRQYDELRARLEAPPKASV